MDRYLYGGGRPTWRPRRTSDHYNIEEDPVTKWLTPEGVRLIAAGEPKRCSGKANAIATGMEAAHHDRLVWTDDDFHHPPDWLATLNADYEKHGPVSEVPYFVGRDPLSVLLEPLYASAGSLGIYRDNRIWGGAVIFERDDIDEAAFVKDLRRTVSDDGLLMEYLQVTTAGLYRIRHHHRSGLEYIGQTGRSLRGRIGALVRNTYKEEIPYRDPHTAAPCLWAVRHEVGPALDVSYTIPPIAKDYQHTSAR